MRSVKSPHDAGFSVVELMIAIAVGAIGIYATVVIMEVGGRIQTSGRAVSDFQTFKTEIMGMIQNGVTCKDVLAPTGASQTVSTVNPTNVNIYQAGTTTVLYAGGRRYGDQLEITNISILPNTTAPAFEANRTYLIGSLRIAATATGRTLSPSLTQFSQTLPIVLSLDGTNQIRDCAAEVPNTGPIRLPTCSPGQVFTFGPPTVGATPIWHCRAI